MLSFICLSFLICYVPSIINSLTIKKTFNEKTPNGSSIRTMRPRGSALNKLRHLLNLEGWQARASAVLWNNGVQNICAENKLTSMSDILHPTGAVGVDCMSCVLKDIL